MANESKADNFPREKTGETVIFCADSNIHAVIDGDANLIALFKQRKIADGAILARRIDVTLDRPAFDGETVHIDVIGLMRVCQFAAFNPSPVRSLDKLETRVRAILFGAAYLPEMLKAMRSLFGMGAIHNVGDQAYFARRVADQYKRHAPHLSGGIDNLLHLANAPSH